MRHKNLASPLLGNKDYPLRLKVLGLSLVLLAQSPIALALDDPQLSGVRSEISRQEKIIKNNHSKLSDLQNKLKTQEKAINSVTLKIRKLGF